MHSSIKCLSFTLFLVLIVSSVVSKQRTDDIEDTQDLDFDESNQSEDFDFDDKKSVFFVKINLLFIYLNVLLVSVIEIKF